MSNYYDKIVATLQAQNEMDIPAFGGNLSVRWDGNAKVTPWGGLSYFATFLKTTGIFDRLVSDAPFKYTSPNSPKVRDVVGTIVLAILNGMTRYVHINRIRNDSVCSELLGMSKIVSEDSVRRALKVHCDEAELNAWLTRHEREVIDALTKYDYVIDIDNTVKTIYGHQEGAELGYNPMKPGRPSHNYHTSFIGSIRMVIGVDVQAGKNHSGSCTMPLLWSFIDSTPKENWPVFLRGDVGYGSDENMREAEKRGIKYIFKIKRSPKVKNLFTSFENSTEWKGCGCGCEAINTNIRLLGWDRYRRCLLVRSPSKDKPKVDTKRGRGRPPKNNPKIAQAEFDFIKDNAGRIWDFYVLVTNDTQFDATLLTQLYRDRGDCENNYDEFKNQWGWCGFVTKDLKPCRAMARLIAIVANWWNVFCRLADSEKHLEATTSRPMLMGIVGRIVNSGRKRIIHLTSTHLHANEIQSALTRISEFMRRISANAEQLEFNLIWNLILGVAFRKYLRPLTIVPT